MSGSWTPIILIELVLVFGAVFGWGFWQLWQLRRDRLEQERRRAADDDATRPPAA